MGGITNLIPGKKEEEVPDPNQVKCNFPWFKAKMVDKNRTMFVLISFTLAPSTLCHFGTATRQQIENFLLLLRSPGNAR